jgi:cytochrome c biogenesis protein CcmG, thiol:disulfide interchange protein DsbE
MTIPSIRNRGTYKCRYRVGAVALVIAVLAATTRAESSGDVLLHKQAPAFVRIDLDNNRIRLAGFRGHVVLLNFWATWYAPCQIETPRFIAWQKQYGPDGLQVLGVSMDDDAAPVRGFSRKLIVNYPVIMGDEKLGLLYGGIFGLPVTYLIDRRGKIRARFQGETDLAVMEREIQKLLSGR